MKKIILVSSLLIGLSFAESRPAPAKKSTFTQSVEVKNVITNQLYPNPFFSFI